jgi:ABC-type antimicrobial peptide transport system permease subunit
LLQGRDFDLSRFPSDSAGVILNESAVKAMGFKEPIGEIIEDSDRKYHVIGVIKDFILHSPYDHTKPIAIEGCQNNWLNIIHVKLNPENTLSHNLRQAEIVFKKYNPGVPFDYTFINEEYAQKFENEKRTASLATLFTALTIFISCLGLFGLSAYMAENRIKEIGVRKVLGASVLDITTLLSLNFLSLVMFAFIVSTPLAWWLMHQWLSDYAYHVEVRLWVFFVAGLLSLLIAVITISTQAIRAALANPVKSLRTE